MKQKHSDEVQLSAAEAKLIEQLREHPELMERFRSILEVTADVDGPMKRADEIEGLLIQELRRLGSATMESWAGRAEKILGEQLQQKDASAVVRKKKR
jgi:5'-deoxynucleotidase YfbR-like HD superfamily hydrolase